MNVVRLNKVTKRFGERIILDDVSIDLPRRGLYAIVGESGSGKSTMLELIAGLDTNYFGDICVLGRSLKNYSEESLAEFRLFKIGYIRQSYDLLNLENVFDNVALPLQGSKLSKRVIKRKVHEALYNCHLHGKDNQITNTLSGGEKQRVALARALVNNPEILLADEPTGALDQTNAENIYKLLRQASKDRLVLLVSHDLERSKQYCDGIIELSNGKLNYQENMNSQNEEKYLSSKIEKKKSGFPLSCWIKHAWHLLKAKKWRTIIFSSVILFSLLSFGLSLYVSRDLGQEINSAFASLTGENVLVIEKAGDSPSFGRIEFASEDEVKNLYIENKDTAKGYGSSYLANFESFFPESNRIFYSSNGKRVLLEGGSLRTLNDFLWLDDYFDKKFYPQIPKVLEQDQICLSLTYAGMVNLCSNLQIVRSYESLGSFLEKGPLSLFLEVQNDEWSYWDLQYFNVVAVTEGDTLSILHYDHSWNEYMLETKMRFPVYKEGEEVLPWTLNKAFYIETKDAPETFFKSLRKKGKNNQYVFERTNHSYDPTHNKDKYAGTLNRYYVYLTDSNYMDYGMIDEIGGLDCFSSFEVYGEQSYSFFPSSLAMGFTNPFFLSDSLEKIELASDALTRLPKDASTNDITLPDGVIEGSIFKPRNKSLTFSNDFSKLVKGRRPENEKEICISRALEEKIPSKNLICAGMVSSYIDGEYRVREYRIGNLEVVGVVEAPLDVIYGDSYWCIDYWRDVFGMSGFNLEPSKASFNIKPNYESEDIIKKLSARYPKIKFTDPSKTVRESVDSVVVFVEVSLEMASFVTLVTCLFLLITVALLTGLENKSEAKLMFTLGIKRKEIADSFSVNLFIVLLYGSLISILNLLILEFTIDASIKEIFSSSGAFIFDIIPLLAIAVVVVVGLLCSCLFMNIWLKKRNFLREG